MHSLRQGFQRFGAESGRPVEGKVLEVVAAGCGGGGSGLGLLRDGDKRRRRVVGVDPVAGVLLLLIPLQRSTAASYPVMLLLLEEPMLLLLLLIRPSVVVVDVIHGILGLLLRLSVASGVDEIISRTFRIPGTTITIPIRVSITPIRLRAAQVLFTFRLLVPGKDPADPCGSHEGTSRGWANPPCRAGGLSPW